jgi:hypothetical protein
MASLLERYEPRPCSRSMLKPHVERSVERLTELCKSMSLRQIFLSNADRARFPSRPHYPARRLDVRSAKSLSVSRGRSTDTERLRRAVGIEIFHETRRLRAPGQERQSRFANRVQDVSGDETFERTIAGPKR